MAGEPRAGRDLLVVVERSAEPLLAALLLACLWGFVAAPGPALSTSIVLFLIAAAVAAGRWPEAARTTPILLAVAVAFLVDSSGALRIAWEVPGFPGRSVAPVVLLALLSGLAWVLGEASTAAQRSWSRAVSWAAMGIIGATAATTLVTAGAGLVDARANATEMGRWLLLLLVFGAVLSVSARSDMLRRRLAFYTLVVLAGGLLRAWL